MTNIFKTIFNPKSIAVIGASRSPQKVGHQVLKNIIDSGFSGSIYPINPSATEILNHKVYPDLESIPQQVDLAVIVTPSSIATLMIEACQRAKVKAVIVITAGFAESGDKGRALQRELKTQIDTGSTAVIGPNCLGCFSVVHHLNATFGPALPQKGPMMLISQSGAIVTGVLDWVNKMGLGLSHAATFGNRIQVGENEALEFAASDPDTKVILTYLESFQDAPTFFRLASRITPFKPVILLKGGQSAAGAAASASHTAALATNYTLIKAFAKQSGVIICDTIDGWLKTAAAFSVTKPAQGLDMAIITNAGGPGVLSSDLASEHQLNLEPLTAATKHKLHQALAHVAPHNPLDILGDALPEHFARSLAILGQDTKLDSLLLIMTPQTTTKPKTTALLLVEKARTLKKPLFVVLLGGEKLEPARKIFEAAHIPTYTYPTEAVETLATLAQYHAGKHAIHLFPGQKPSIVNGSTKAHFERQLSLPLTLDTAFELLTAYGFKLPTSRIISEINDIPKTLRATGVPVVAKTAALNLAHKASLGGVKLGLMTGHQAQLAFRQLQRLDNNVLFQQTIKGPLELILGAKRDTQLGPFITIGLGGALTNTLDDRAYAFIPTSKSYLEKAFKQTKAYHALMHLHLPVEPVIDAMIRLSAIMLDYPTIAEMEINPAIITDKHLYCCDIKITRETSSATTA